MWKITLKDGRTIQASDWGSFQEGKAAGVLGLPKNRNPYDPDLNAYWEHWSAWNAGWERGHNRPILYPEA